MKGVLLVIFCIIRLILSDSIIFPIFLVRFIITKLRKMVDMIFHEHMVAEHPMVGQYEIPWTMKIMYIVFFSS